MTTLAQHNARLKKAGLPTVETITRRILATWGRATKAQVEQGTVWYSEAQELAFNLGRNSGHGAEKAAAVISHLSPRTSWARNTTGAITLMVYGEKAEGIIGANFDRAVTALKADDVEATFGGNKTHRFFRNIMGDTESVTVDVWAARVAGVDETLLSRVGVYAAVEAAYQRAAHRVGVEPTTMQATTWIVARNGRAA